MVVQNMESAEQTVAVLGKEKDVDDWL